MHDDKRKKRHMNLAQRISFYFFRENRVVIWGDTRERCSCSCKCPVPFSCFHTMPCHASTAAALMAIKRFSNMQRIFTENVYWDLLAPVHYTIAVTLHNLHAVLKAELWKQNLHSKTMTHSVDFWNFPLKRTPSGVIYKPMKKTKKLWTFGQALLGIDRDWHSQHRKI